MTSIIGNKATELMHATVASEKKTKAPVISSQVLGKGAPAFLLP